MYCPVLFNVRCFFVSRKTTITNTCANTFYLCNKLPLKICLHLIFIMSGLWMENHPLPVLPLATFFSGLFIFTGGHSGLYSLNSKIKPFI
jgi:hypothetical protein